MCCALRTADVGAMRLGGILSPAPRPVWMLQVGPAGRHPFKVRGTLIPVNSR